VTANAEKLIEIENLSVRFPVRGGAIAALDEVCYDIYKGEILGVVGESGCGKSMTALSIMGLTPAPRKDISGTVRYHEDNLLNMSNRELSALRGNKFSMIFQDAMTSLNPMMQCGKQVQESFRAHLKLNKPEARERTIDLFRKVGIALPEQRVKEYPHQLSGGMRQRVMIAMAFACKPELLIADEPTTALDVTIQAQILKLIRDIRDESRMSVLLITHDLGVVAEIAERVVVMYAGRVVEIANVYDIFREPVHPYTKGLLRSMPAMSHLRKRFVPIEGSVPAMLADQAGCGFYGRCPYAEKQCGDETPLLADLGNGRQAACHMR
jgi:oligopeptide/dipeptide ABC transporter ATP-binding protein